MTAQCQPQAAVVRNQIFPLGGGGKMRGALLNRHFAQQPGQGFRARCLPMCEMTMSYNFV